MMAREPIDGALPPTRGALWLTGAWTAAGTMLYLLWPALAPVLLPLCLVVPTAWYWQQHPRVVLLHSNVSIVLLVAVCYGLINAHWSLAKEEAYTYVVTLLVVLICLHIGLSAWVYIPYGPGITAMAVGFCVGFILAGCLLCSEILSNHIIFYHLITMLPQLWSHAPEYVSAGTVPPYFLNHRMAALAILFWPVLLSIVRLVTTRLRRLFLVGLVPSLVAIAASEHATSQVAMVVGACVVITCQWSLRAAERLLMMVWVTACLAVVPLCLAAYAANMHHIRWLAPSAQDRLVIWKATSDLIPKAPWLGVGIHSGRIMTQAEVDRPTAPGTPYALSVGWHSHNAFLQVWFETGAVGAGILLCFGLLTLRSIGFQDEGMQPFLFATFATCTVIAGTGFSAFAPWLVASFAVCALFAALATAQGQARLRSEV
jgi:exopolysaccharide production protein ExoQ